MRMRTLVVLAVLSFLTVGLPQTGMAQTQPDTIELHGWCCHNGKVFPAPGAECLEVNGQFYADQQQAKINCVPEPPMEDGWCCRNGKLFPFAGEECHQLGGQFFADQNAAEQACGDAPHGEAGWCCRDGDVFQSPEAECREVGGSFYEHQGQAEEECAPGMPGDEGWCCHDGHIFPAPEPECHERGGAFFHERHMAESECHPGEHHPEEGWCCHEGEVFPAPEPECHEHGGAFYPERHMAEAECRPGEHHHEEGWCCVHGEVHPAPEEECRHLGGEFFPEREMAMEHCGGDHPHHPHGDGPNCACIYYEYLPKLIDDSLFWAGVSFTNVGKVRLSSIVGHIYEADGSHFQTSFPELGIMNKHTYLLIQDENGLATLTEVNGDGSVKLKGQGSGKKYGTMRGSMFIIGCSEEHGHAELDGFLLLGSGGEVNGSYLVRKRPLELCPME